VSSSYTGLILACSCLFSHEAHAYHAYQMQYESERCYNLPIVNFCFVYYMILVSFDQYAHYVVLSKLAKKCRNSAKNTDSTINKLCYIFFVFFLNLYLFKVSCISSVSYLYLIFSSHFFRLSYLIFSISRSQVSYLIFLD
jgi:hypothetical protein